MTLVNLFIRWMSYIGSFFNLTIVEEGTMNSHGRREVMRPSLRAVREETHSSHREEAIARGNRLSRENTRYKHTLTLKVSCDLWAP